MTQQDRILKLAQEKIAYFRANGARHWGKSLTNAMMVAIEFTLNNLWVSVTEELPEQNRNVLALNASGDVLVAFYDEGTWWWCDGFICGEKENGDKKYSSSCEIDSITHWMPIPALPKGGKQ